MKYSIYIYSGLSVMLFALPLFGTTYTMTPDDDWTVLEEAEAGDVVEIAPGTYRFRVHLDNVGTEDEPIVIRAQNAEDRPVWDLVGDEDNRVSEWPGSYTAGDLGRGGWQVGPDGAHYEISGIVFRNCRDSSSAGIRMVNSGPVRIYDCLFEYNTNGLTGTSEDLVVEHCEFRKNGKTFEGGAMTHNIYIYGGKFTMRYSFSHDSHEGQLFHIRAADSLLEYNWFARPSSYVGDIMTCNYLCGDEPVVQNMTLRGNVIIQGTPLNGSQIIALYHDEGPEPESFNATLQYNTIIGTPRNPGQTHALLNMRNDSVATHATVDNNIIYQVADVAVPADEGLDNWSVEGVNNWVSDGTGIDGLDNTVTGTEPGFKDAASFDFTLEEGAQAQGMANTESTAMPPFEYYKNEDNPMMYRQRSSAADAGAFETGTRGEGIGPYDEVPEVDSDSGSDADTDIDTDADSDFDTDVDTDMDTEADSEMDSEIETEGSNKKSDSSGCGCAIHSGHFRVDLYALLLFSGFSL